MEEKSDKGTDILYKAAWTIFYVMAAIVTWNWAAPESWWFMTETWRKIWGMAGLGLYVVLIFERRRRSGGETGLF